MSVFLRQKKHPYRASQLTMSKESANGFLEHLCVISECFEKWNQTRSAVVYAPSRAPASAISSGSVMLSIHTQSIS